MGGMIHLLYKRRKLTPDQESAICQKCQFCCRWLGYKVDLKINNPEYYKFISEWGVPMSLHDGNVVHFFVPFPCKHINDKKGCKSYETRPEVCRAYRGGDADSAIIPYCGWYEALGDDERFNVMKGIEWGENPITNNPAA